MHLLMKGISHKTAPILIRERFSFGRKGLQGKLALLRSQEGIKGGVIVSTCNRVEVYVVAQDHAAGEEVLNTVLCFNVDINRFDEKLFYTYADKDAVTHLFRVTSGVDSQVLGETQIMAQVRSAWEDAQEYEVSCPILDKLFHSALIVARRSHSKTAISRGNVSVGSVAMYKCQEQLKTLAGKTVLIIGAGKIARLMASYLKKAHMHAIFVSSRTFERAEKLAHMCNGEAIHFDVLPEKIGDVDIIMSSTSAPHAIIQHNQIVDVMRNRNQPLLIIDLGVPRDIAPSIRNITGVLLYDLDDLKNVVEENYALREGEIVKVDGIVKRYCGKFYQNIEHRMCL